MEVGEDFLTVQGDFMGVGMPGDLKLKAFGEIVRDAFGEVAYHVGSSLLKKRGWRDVDVRVIVSDQKYEAMGFGDPARPHTNAKWVAITLAFCALGKEMTGLPIDFQIQQQSHANKLYSTHDGHLRGALLAPWKLK